MEFTTTEENEENFKSTSRPEVQEITDTAQLINPLEDRCQPTKPNSRRTSDINHSRVNSRYSKERSSPTDMVSFGNEKYVTQSYH